MAGKRPDGEKGMQPSSKCSDLAGGKCCCYSLWSMWFSALIDHQGMDAVNAWDGHGDNK